MPADRYNANHGKDGKFSGKGGGGAGPIDTSGLTGGTGPIGDDEAEANLQGVLDRADHGPSFTNGTAWYGNAHGQIGKRAAEIGVDPQKFAGMVAATSPRCTWQTKTGRLMNIDLAAKAHETAQQYPGMTGKDAAAAVKSPGMLRANLANAIDIDHGVPVGDVLGGPKTRSFYNNLAFVNGTKDVTVDTHMVSAMAGNHALPQGEVKKYATTKYGWSADRIRAVADTNGLPPAQAQAVIWEQWKQEGGSSFRAEQLRRAAELRAWSATGDPLPVDEDEPLGAVEEDMDEDEVAAFIDAPLPEAARFNAHHGKDGKFSGKGGGGLAFAVAPITAAEARGNSRAVSDDEFQALAGEGSDMLDGMRADSSPCTGLDANWDSIKADAFGEVQKPWGGATIDAHTGQPLRSDADAYALSIKPQGMDSVSVRERASQEEFGRAMDVGRERFRPELENRDSYLGVFHDDDNRRIDIDPVTVVKTPHEVEAIGAFTHAIGGAYHFKSGDGYWPPHVGESRAVDTSLGQDVHWAGPGQWRSAAEKDQKGQIHRPESTRSSAEEPRKPQAGRSAMDSKTENNKSEGPWMAELQIPVVRSAGHPLELRDEQATDPNSLGLLTGHFSRFGDWYEVDSMWEGRFMERVLRGAFEQTITEDQDAMRVLFEHGFDPQIGSKPLGPLRTVQEDREGAYYEVPMFDTAYNRELLPGLRARVYGASMRMKVRQETWNDEPGPSDYNPNGLPERTIRNAKVPEFGPVTFGASPTATASIRSATDRYYELLARSDENAYATAVRSVRAVRPDFTGAPDIRSGAGRGERKEPEQAPGEGAPAADFNPLSDPEQRHLYLRQIGVLHVSE